MPQIELDARRIRARLEREGWFLKRQDGPHDVYGHPSRPGRVVMPRHRRDLQLGLARSIARAAGWL